MWTNQDPNLLTSSGFLKFTGLSAAIICAVMREARLVRSWEPRSGRIGETCIRTVNLLSCQEPLFFLPPCCFRRVQQNRRQQPDVGYRTSAQFERLFGGCSAHMPNN
jgi:hypothetical protein